MIYSQIMVFSLVRTILIRNVFEILLHFSWCYKKIEYSLFIHFMEGQEL